MFLIICLILDYIQTHKKFSSFMTFLIKPFFSSNYIFWRLSEVCAWPKSICLYMRKHLLSWKLPTCVLDLHHVVSLSLKKISQPSSNIWPLLFKVYAQIWSFEFSMTIWASNFFIHLRLIRKVLWLDSRVYSQVKFCVCVPNCLQKVAHCQSHYFYYVFYMKNH